MSATPTALPALRLHLEARRGDLEQAVLARVHSISAPRAVADPTYLDGLRTAVSDAIDYALAGIERSEERPAPVPVSLLAQARLAARSGVGLDTVLRRYSAGHAVLSGFLVDAAETSSRQDIGLKHVLRTQASLFDRLISAVTIEYNREAGARLSTPEQRRAELVRRLLDGELADAPDLAYGFDAFHLGAVAIGDGAAEALQKLSGTLDARLLAVRRKGLGVWAWLGTRHPIPKDRLSAAFSSFGTAGPSVAIGEPARGLTGWRLTHRQASAALPFALRGPDRLVHYADVALLASIRQDELLSTSLHQLYIAPLEGDRDRGRTARQTLRAYFAAGRNVSSAAAALGVNRNTIANRLHAIERQIGRSLASCAAELEAALRLEQLGDPAESAAHPAIR